MSRHESPRGRSRLVPEFVPGQPRFARARSRGRPSRPRGLPRVRLSSAPRSARVFPRSPEVRLSRIVQSSSPSHRVVKSRPWSAEPPTEVVRVASISRPWWSVPPVSAVPGPRSVCPCWWSVRPVSTVS